VRALSVIPPSGCLERFADFTLGDRLPLGLLLDQFSIFLTVEHGEFFALDTITAMKQRAALFEDIPLSTSDKLWFCTAPIDVMDPIVSRAATLYAAKFADTSGGIGCGFDDRILRTPQSVRDTDDLASVILALGVYYWLSGRFPDRFIEHRYVVELREDAKRVLQDST